MTLRYSAKMPKRQPARTIIEPAIWLVSDARNDHPLDHALDKLPRGSGLIFRHYHLSPADRQTRFKHLAKLARRRGHVVVLADTRATAKRWGADYAYGPKGHFIPVHSLRELGAAHRLGADAILLSPVFPTRSHPDGKTLGPVRFRLLASRASCPVIALGGMTQRRARQLAVHSWAAIDAFLG